MVENFVQSLVDFPTWIASIFFFVSAFLQLTFPPYPGDTLLIFGGYAGSVGLFGGNIPIFVSYWSGTVIFSILLYELGKWKGERLLEAKFISKYFPPASQENAKRWISRFGIYIFFFCKFIPGLNSITIICGGIFNYSRKWAYFGVTFAATVHNLIFFYIGRTIGSNWESIALFLSLYNRIVIGVAVLFLLIWVGLWWKNKKRAKGAA